MGCKVQHVWNVCRSCCNTLLGQVRLTAFFLATVLCGILILKCAFADSCTTHTVLRSLSNVRDFYLDADIVLFDGNVGMTAFLFDNPKYRKHFMTLGTRPEDAYRCAIDFLFTPNAAVREHFNHEFEVLAGDIFKVAIQLRLGDSYLSGRADRREAAQRHIEAKLHHVQHFFDCAKQLEQTYKTDGQDSVWFVVSDSLAIRQLANATYAGKVMTRVTQPGHVLAAEGDSKETTMIEAAGEHWLLALTDYQIVSDVGSFGKTGALRKRSWHTIYRLPVSRIPATNEIVCDGVTTRPLDYGQIARWPPFV